MSRDCFEVEVLLTILPLPSFDPKRMMKWMKSESGCVCNSSALKETFYRVLGKGRIFIVENYERLGVFP